MALASAARSPARLVGATALHLGPPAPKGALPPLAARAAPLEPFAPGAVCKAALKPRAQPQAPMLAPGAPSQYEYETPVYYTSAAEAPEELAAAEKKA